MRMNATFLLKYHTVCLPDAVSGAADRILQGKMDACSVAELRVRA